MKKTSQKTQSKSPEKDEPKLDKRERMKASRIESILKLLINKKQDAMTHFIGTFTMEFDESSKEWILPFRGVQFHTSITERHSYLALEVNHINGDRHFILHRFTFELDDENKLSIDWTPMDSLHYNTALDKVESKEEWSVGIARVLASGLHTYTQLWTSGKRVAESRGWPQKDQVILECLANNNCQMKFHQYQYEKIQTDKNSCGHYTIYFALCDMAGLDPDYWRPDSLNQGGAEETELYKLVLQIDSLYEEIATPPPPEAESVLDAGKSLTTAPRPSKKTRPNTNN